MMSRKFALIIITLALTAMLFADIPAVEADSGPDNTPSAWNDITFFIYIRIITTTYNPYIIKIIQHSNMTIGQFTIE